LIFVNIQFGHLNFSLKFGCDLFDNRAKTSAIPRFSSLLKNIINLNQEKHTNIDQGLFKN
jgi:hypothetical protein